MVGGFRSKELLVLLEEETDPSVVRCGNGGTNTSVNQHYCLMKNCSVRSKHRHQYQSDNRETNDPKRP